jgi:ectoine hydroxylase-related dioxygenase (phytanoyl-CoA dioxygenase family)
MITDFSQFCRFRYPLFFVLTFDLDLNILPDLLVDRSMKTNKISQCSINISEEIITEFEDSGVVVLRNVVEESWLNMLATAVEKALVWKGEFSELYTDIEDPGLFYNDFYMWQRIPEFRDWAFNGPGAEIAHKIMRSRQVNFFYDQLFLKEPGLKAYDSGVTPWHQDSSYMAVDGGQFCSTWVSLDALPKEATVQYVAGSHRWEYDIQPFDKFTDGSEYLEGKFVPAADFETEPDRYQILQFEIEPGDCLVFQGRVVHRGAGNTSQKQRRRAIANRWVGDNATYAIRVPPAEFPHKVPQGVRHGTPMRDYEEYFPRVWPRAGKL